MAVRFTLVIDLSRGSGVYEGIINTIRDNLHVGERIEGVAILGPQAPPQGPFEYFNVNLLYTDRGRTYTIQAQFRVDNLYMVRYRAGTTGAWQQLDGIENYNTLTRRDDGAIELEDVPLSCERIGAAITTLARGETSRGPRARAILTIIFTVSEAARFRDIERLIVGAWEIESTPGPHYAARVRSWQRMSSAVQRTRNDGHTFDFNGLSTDIWAFVSAILSLGIMRRYDAPNPPNQPGGFVDASPYSAFARGIKNMVNTATRLGRAVDTTSYSAFAKGQPLLEILYVRLDYIDGGTPAKLHGSVTVIDSAGTYSIWQHQTNNTVDIYPQDKILLEGPFSPMSAADEFYIQLDLWDHVGVSSDDSIAKGTIVFNPLDSYTAYDVVKVHNVQSDHGAVTVGYVAITDGLYAQISVVLIDGNGEYTPNVYGELTANNGYGQTDLLRKAKDQYFGVPRGNEIPLLKTVVAVPTVGHLNIQANLWVHNSTSGDDEIAYGTVEFTPLYKQSQKKTITGENGKVELRVTWM